MDLASPPDLGFLTPAEMAGVEADRAKGLLDVLDDEGHVRGVPVNMRPLDAPPVEVWLTNPLKYLPVVKRLPYPRYVSRIDNVARAWRDSGYLDLVEAMGEVEFDLLVIAPNGAVRYDKTSHPARNDGVLTPCEYIPLWTEGDNPEELIRMCRAFKRRGWSRIVVDIPNRAHGKQVDLAKQARSRTLNWSHKVALAFPDVKLHFTNGGEYRFMFGLAWSAVDVDPALYLSTKITLPSGRRITTKQANGHLKWLHVLGYSVSDIKCGPDERVMFNIASALWAAENFCSKQTLAHTRQGKREDPFGLLPDKKRAGTGERLRRNDTHRRMADLEVTPDYTPQFGSEPDEPYALAQPITGMALVPIKPRRPETYDKVLCNSCSLAPKCNYFRESGVCILPSSDTAALVRIFGSRDSEMIAQGIADVLSIQAQRHGKLAVAWDQTVEEIKEAPASQVIAKSKHLTELESSLIKGSEALIRVLSPDTTVGSNVPAVNATQINVYNPATLVADVVRRLEAKGISRDAIDPAQIVAAAQEQGLVPLSEPES